MGMPDLVQDREQHAHFALHRLGVVMMRRGQLAKRSKSIKQDSASKGRESVAPGVCRLRGTNLYETCHLFYHFGIVACRLKSKTDALEDHKAMSAVKALVQERFNKLLIDGKGITREDFVCGTKAVVASILKSKPTPGSWRFFAKLKKPGGSLSVLT